MESSTIQTRLSAVERVMGGEDAVSVAASLSVSVREIEKWLEVGRRALRSGLSARQCDLCASEIGEDGLYHHTGVLGGTINHHVHLCGKCQSRYESELPCFNFDALRGASTSTVAGNGDSANVETPSGGTVIAILRRLGDQVEEGDELVTIETAKMFLRIVAPRRGRIAKILCTEGQFVRAGTCLVMMSDVSTA